MIISKETCFPVNIVLRVSLPGTTVPHLTCGTPFWEPSPRIQSHLLPSSVTSVNVYLSGTTVPQFTCTYPYENLVGEFERYDPVYLVIGVFSRYYYSTTSHMYHPFLRTWSEDWRISQGIYRVPLKDAIQCSVTGYLPGNTVQNLCKQKRRGSIIYNPTLGSCCYTLPVTILLLIVLPYDYQQFIIIYVNVKFDFN